MSGCRKSKNSVDFSDVAIDITLFSNSLFNPPVKKFSSFGVLRLSSFENFPKEVYFWVFVLLSLFLLL